MVASASALEPDPTPTPPPPRRPSAGCPFRRPFRLPLPPTRHAPPPPPSPLPFLSPSPFQICGDYSPHKTVAGTLTETLAATSRWGNEISSKDVEQMRRDESLNKHTAFLKYLEKKLALAKGKVKRAEKALAKVQENLRPADLPVDLETISDEERSLLRKIGLSMKPFLLIGEVIYDGVKASQDKIQDKTR
ncbi:CRM-domain containing factor CFM3B, chloroplastic-like [Eucalyptus grandis]|uniref:CRM-domain containing factor CFM3B, chloroplastic-like n=1 Tax=Eucalyptus grandis TaxID=71139 RepID=UPI00192EAD64|nr:CRM-domain containing factor CFM3B, chloroplastic-like [Eucalyptus grandis]